NGPFSSIFQFSRRVNPRAVNKKVYENLVYGGAFDCFGLNRAQYFFKPENSSMNGIEKLVKYCNDYLANQNSAQDSLCRGTSEAEISEPVIPACEECSQLDNLRYEEESIGIHLTGHPRDNYRFEIDHFCSGSVRQLTLIDRIKVIDASDEE